MRFVVVAAVLGWLAFQGGAVVLVLSGSVVPGAIAEGGAVLTAGLLWLLGARGGIGKINVTSTKGRKARG